MKSNWLEQLDIKEQEKDKAVLKQVMPSVYEFLDALEEDNPDSNKLILNNLLKSITSFFFNDTEISEKRPDCFAKTLRDCFARTDEITPDKVFEHDPTELVLTKKSIDAFYKLKNVIDWSNLSPMVLSVIYESVIAPKDRRENGMHYTSVENIHKVVDPLFLDELVEKLEAIKRKPLDEQLEALEAFRGEIGNLTMLDPACGSGNFLFIVYQDLRRLENKVLEMELKIKRTLEFRSVCNQLIGEPTDECN